MQIFWGPRVFGTSWTGYVPGGEEVGRVGRLMGVSNWPVE